MMKSKKIKMMLAVFTAFTLGSTAISLNYPNTDIVAEAAAEDNGKAATTEVTYGNLKYSISGDEASIIGYTGSDSSIEIPDYINVGTKSYEVTSINNGAFDHNSNVENVIMPDTIKSIGDYSFFCCEKLKNIKLSNNITKIGYTTFAWCTSLESIDIPENVTTIGLEAFKGCTSLKTLSLPKNISSINTNPFFRCDNLIAINVDSENNIYKSCDGVLYSKDMKTLFCYPQGKSGGYSIIDGTTTIGPEAFFDCQKINKINVPDSVTTIKNSAFRLCENLNNINLPDSITSIEDGIFMDCSKLESIAIPEKITTIPKDMFECCSSLKNIKLPGELQTIGEFAFYACNSLKTIEIPNSVKTIERDAFLSCESLESIIYPYRDDNNKYLKPNGWDSYYTIQLSGDNYNEVQLVKPGKKLNTERDNCMINLYQNSKYTTDYIPTSEDKYFNISRKTILDTDYIIAKEEGYAGFCKSASIRPKEKGAKISYDNVNYSDKINLDEEDCGKKTIYIKFANGEIGKGTVDFGEIKIDKTVPTINVSGDLETKCHSLNLNISKTFGKSGAKVTVSKDGGEEQAVDEDTFEVKDNGTYKFTITTGAGITEYETLKVSNIIKDGDYSYSFNEENKTASITHYIGTDSYITLPGTITKDDVEYKVTSIAANAFKNCNSLAYIKVPDSITKINSYTFNACKNLKSIKLSNTITKIDNYTFADCTSLEEIEIPSSVKEIGDYAFVNCTSLKKISIPCSIESIGTGAFLKCTSLTKVDFDNTNLTLGRYDFKNCNSLKNMILRNSGNYDILKDKGLNLDDYYKVILKDDTYTEVQLVKKGGNMLIPEDEDNYYNIYDGDTKVFDYTIYEDKTYRIVKKKAKEEDYTLNGAKGYDGWYSSDVSIKPLEYNNPLVGISEDGLNWAGSLLVTNNLDSDKVFYIRDKEGLISKGRISKDLIKIDKIKPTIEVNGDLTTKADKIDLNINATAGKSGVYKVTVSKDGGEEEVVEGNTYEVNVNGNYVFKVTSLNGLSTTTSIDVNNVTLSMNYNDFSFECNDDEGTAKINGYTGDDDTILIPSKVKINNKEYKVDSIDDFAFSDAESLVKVVMDDNITSIGDSAFYSCTALKDIKLSEEITSIGENTFGGCSSLKDINISDKVQSIGESAFKGCTALESFNAPESLTTINTMAFSDCTNLKTVVLPNTLTSIGDNIFDGVDSLQNVIIKNGENYDILNNSGLDFSKFYTVKLEGESYKEIQLVNKEGASLIYDNSKYKLCDMEGNEVTSLELDGDKEFKLVEIA